jgi:hypothetical protein
MAQRRPAGGASCPGGGIGCGTLFAVSPAGIETVLHRFGTEIGIHAFYPGSTLIDFQGALYGTKVEGGGLYDPGTV